MTQQEFLKIMAVIKLAYPTAKIAKDQTAVEMWWNYLKGEECSRVANLVDNHIRTNKFPPTIAELIASEQPKLGTNYGDKNFDWDKFRREHINLQFGTALPAGQWLHGEELEKALAET